MPVCHNPHARPICIHHYATTTYCCCPTCFAKDKDGGDILSSFPNDDDKKLCAISAIYTAIVSLGDGENKCISCSMIYSPAAVMPNSTTRIKMIALVGTNLLLSNFGGCRSINADKLGRASSIVQYCWTNVTDRIQDGHVCVDVVDCVDGE